MTGALGQLVEECRIAMETSVETTVPKVKEYKVGIISALREKGMFEPIVTPCHLLSGLFVLLLLWLILG